MADEYVTRAKQRELAAELERLGVTDGELVEKFILGSGSGGQKVNKTSSCVYLKHEPTGIEVKCQRSRSREKNRFLARRELCETLKERIRGEKSKRRQAAERIRRQKRRRSRRQKERMLELKHRQSVKKQQRARVSVDE